ncbi:hypothetical protein [Sphingomonas sp. T1]|uniref:hypothetical protein n=1 Tax=Sphingomonas sp. T1 TaxID=2653172 RepID=UPI001356783B|nr:hypothetical protein [Sphingomonas sp. T1]
MSEVYQLMNELEQVGHIASVENVVNQLTSTVIVTFDDGRVTRIVYEKMFADRLLGRSL